MTRRSESITLSVSPEEKQKLEQIAQLFGQTWGDKPNISRLMRAIALGTLKVVWADEPSALTEKQIASLKAAACDAQETIVKLLRLL